MGDMFSCTFSSTAPQQDSLPQLHRACHRKMETDFIRSFCRRNGINSVLLAQEPVMQLGRRVSCLHGG